MSTALNTVIEPEVLTDHTEIICSTSIERIVTGRNTALTQIEALIHQLEDISAITDSIRRGSGKRLGYETRLSLWLLADGESKNGHASDHPQS